MKFSQALLWGLLPQCFAFSHDRDELRLGKRHARRLIRPCVQGCGCISDFDVADDFFNCANGVKKDTRDRLLAQDSSLTTGASQTTFTSTKSNNCKDKGGPCDCDYIQDKNSDEYRQCLSNPDCERCYFTQTWSPTTMTTMTRSSLVSGPVTTTPTNSTVTTTSSSTSKTTIAPPRPPDNCYIGGPCDCSLIADKKSPEYVRCVSNAACEHCFLNNGTLTTRPTTLVTQQTTLDITSTSSTVQGRV